MSDRPMSRGAIVCAAGLLLCATAVAHGKGSARKDYLVAEIEVTNSAVYAEYVRQVTPMVAAFGGRYLVRAGTSEALEGRALEGRMVVLEFPSLAAARAFYYSPEYLAILSLRTDNAKSRIILIEGYDP